MGFFKTIGRWLGNVGSVMGNYSGLKDIVGNVYGGIKNVVHTVGGVVDKVDSFIQNVKNENIPIVSDLAAVASGNPLYTAILRGSKYANEIVDTAGQIGTAVDKVASSIFDPKDEKSTASTAPATNALPNTTL